MTAARRSVAALAAAAILAGCGSTTTTITATTAPGSAASESAARPQMSPAKRRYLAHFRSGCGGVDSFAASSTARIKALVRRIGAGDAAALRRLTSYLRALARAFGSGLARTRALGMPPGPDAADGRAYFDQAARIVAAIRALAQSVARVDGAGVAAADRQLTSATAAAHAAAQRYGFPTCAASSPARPGAGGTGAGGAVA